MKIVLLGAPGSGKGTQAAKLSEYYGIPLISTVSVLKEATSSETEAGLQAKAYQDQNQHVPDEILMLALRDRFAEPDIHNGFLLVGFPRTAAQADALEGVLEELNLPLDLVLRLEGDPDHFMERLEGRRICQSCGANYNVFTAPPIVEEVCDLCGGRVKRRADDNEETIANRMRIYENQSASLVRYYTLHGKLRQIDGGQGDEEVFRALRQIIDEHPPTIIETEPVVEAPVPLHLSPPAEPAVAATDTESRDETPSPGKPESKGALVKPEQGPGEKPRRLAARQEGADAVTPPTRRTGAGRATSKSAATKSAGTPKTAVKKAATKPVKKTRAASPATKKKAAAKKTTAKKTAPQKLTAAKSPAKATKKAAPRKAIQKKAPSRKTTPAKPAQKTVAKRSAPTPAKKVVQKKAPTRKAAPATPSKKTAAKRSAPTPAKKVVQKKAPTRKTASATPSRKPVAKRPAPKPAATPVKKVAIKRPVQKKGAAKKALQKKAPTGKTAAAQPSKKPMAKRPAPKPAAKVAKKVAIKKPVQKKGAAKKALQKKAPTGKTAAAQPSKKAVAKRPAPKPAAKVAKKVVVKKASVRKKVVKKSAAKRR